MAIIEIKGGRITHKYLMGKTKWELARMYLDLLERYEKLCDEKETTMEKAAKLIEVEG